MKPGLSCRFYPAKTASVISEWVADRIPGCERGFGPCVALGVFRGAELVGGVVYHNWNPESGVMEMSAAGNHWLNRAVLQHMHGYIFDQAGCQLAVLRVSENNTRMLRIAEAYGYRKHLIPRLRGRDEAEAILTLTVEDWRSSRFHR